MSVVVAAAAAADDAAAAAQALSVNSVHDRRRRTHARWQPSNPDATDVVHGIVTAWKVLASPQPTSRDPRSNLNRAGFCP